MPRTNNLETMALTSEVGCRRAEIVGIHSSIHSVHTILMSGSLYSLLVYPIKRKNKITHMCKTKIQTELVNFVIFRSLDHRLRFFESVIPADTNKLLKKFQMFTSTCISIVWFNNKSRRINGLGFQKVFQTYQLSFQMAKTCLWNKLAIRHIMSPWTLTELNWFTLKHRQSSSCSLLLYSLS